MVWIIWLELLLCACASAPRLATGAAFPESLSDLSSGLGELFTEVITAVGGPGAGAAAAKAALAAGALADKTNGGKGKQGRLCIPADERRAYVTLFYGPVERLWSVRVLAASLRAHGGKNTDVVVMLPASLAANRHVRSRLQQERLLSYVIPTSLPPELHPAVAARVSAWTLTAYQRVIFFDSAALVLRNPDALFACEGLCLRRDTHYTASSAHAYSSSGSGGSSSSSSSSSDSGSGGANGGASSASRNARARHLATAGPSDGRSSEEHGIGPWKWGMGTGSSSRPSSHSSGVHGLPSGAHHYSMDVMVLEPSSETFFLMRDALVGLVGLRKQHQRHHHAAAAAAAGESNSGYPSRHSHSSSDHPGRLRGHSLTAAEPMDRRLLDGDRASSSSSSHHHSSSGQNSHHHSAASHSDAPSGVLNAATFFSSFFDLDHCGSFGTSGSEYGGSSGGGGSGSGNDFEPVSNNSKSSSSSSYGGFSNGGPRVLLGNPEAVPRCGRTDFTPSPGACHLLPYTYNAPAADFGRAGTVSLGLPGARGGGQVVAAAAAAASSAATTANARSRYAGHSVASSSGSGSGTGSPVPSSFGASSGQLPAASSPSFYDLATAAVFPSSATSSSYGQAAPSLIGDSPAGAATATTSSSSSSSSASLSSSGAPATTSVASAAIAATNAAAAAAAVARAAEARAEARAEPHVLRFDASDQPWSSLAYLRNPLYWRWDSYRSTLANPYGEPADLWALWITVLFPFCVLTLSSLVCSRALGFHGSSTKTSAYSTHISSSSRSRKQAAAKRQAADLLLVSSGENDSSATFSRSSSNRSNGGGGSGGDRRRRKGGHNDMRHRDVDGGDGDGTSSSSAHDGGWLGSSSVGKELGVDAAVDREQVQRSMDSLKPLPLSRDDDDDDFHDDLYPSAHSTGALSQSSMTSDRHSRQRSRCSNGSSNNNVSHGGRTGNLESQARRHRGSSRNSSSVNMSMMSSHGYPVCSSRSHSSRSSSSLTSCAALALWEQSPWRSAREITRACVVCACGAVGGLLWFELSLQASVGVVRNAWHPAAAVVAYQGWLCLGLVSGLLVADAWLAPLYASAHESTARTLQWVVRQQQQQRLQMMEQLQQRKEEEEEEGELDDENESRRDEMGEGDDEDERSFDMGGNSSGDAALLMVEEAALSGNSSSGHSSSSRSQRQPGRSNKVALGVHYHGNCGANDVLFRIVHAVVSAGHRILRVSLSWAALSFVFRVAFQLLQSTPPGGGNRSSSSRHAHGFMSSSSGSSSTGSSSAFGSSSSSDIYSFTGSSGFGLEGAAEHAFASALSEEAERLARVGLSAVYFHPVLGSDGAWLGAWAMPLLAAALLLAACERRSAAASSSSSLHAKSSKSSSSSSRRHYHGDHSQTNFNSSAFSSNQLIAQLTPPRARNSALDRTEPAIVRSSSSDPSSACNQPPENSDLPPPKTSKRHHQQSQHALSSSSSSTSSPLQKEVPVLPQLARQNHFRATLLLCALAACAALAVCCWVVVTVELKGAALDTVTACHKWGFALVCACLAAPPMLTELVGWCASQLAISVGKVARCALFVLGFGSELQGDYLGGKGSSSNSSVHSGSTGVVGYFRTCFPYGSASERRKCARRVAARAILAGLAFLIVSWAYGFAAEKMPFQLPAQCYASSSGSGSSVGARGSGFLSWRSLRLQAHCSDAESFQLHYTDVYQEAYKQFKVCLRAHGNFAPVAGGTETPTASSSSSSSSNEGRSRFLTLDRRVSSVCEPANQLVLQPVDGASSATYCLYSPVRGLFVSASGRPSALCRGTERFTVTGRARPREALKGLFGLVPAFCKANFLVQSPWYALVAYVLIALCELRRHSSSSTQPQPQSRGKGAAKMKMTCELVSASAWFMVSLHVLYFVAYANENYVFGSRAFRDAADAHWQDLEQLESMVGLRQLAASLRRFILGASPNAPKRLCHAIALLRLGASSCTALAVLLHMGVAALKADPCLRDGGAGRDTLCSSSSSSSSSFDFSKHAQLPYLSGGSGGSHSSGRRNGMRSFDAGRSSGGIFGSSRSNGSQFQGPGQVHSVGGLRCSNVVFQRAKVAMALAHVLAALGSAAWPVGRPRAIGVELPLPSTEGCWWAPFAPKPRKRPYSRSAQPPKPLEPASAASAATYLGVVPARTRRGRSLLAAEHENAEKRSGSSHSIHRVSHSESSLRGGSGGDGESGDGTRSSSSSSSSSSSPEEVDANSKVGGRREALSTSGLLGGNSLGSSRASNAGAAASTMSFSDRLAGIGGGFLDFSGAGGFSNSGSDSSGNGGKNYALRDLVSGGKAYDRGPAFNCFGQDQNLPGQLPAFGYAAPSLWAQYAHGIFCAYWYAASPSSLSSTSLSMLSSKPASARRRCLHVSLMQGLALVYLACMLWSSTCLGMEGAATWCLAIGCNRLAWRLAGATASKSFLAQCCCPWLPPLVAAMKGLKWLQQSNSNHPNSDLASVNSQDHHHLHANENNVNSSNSHYDYDAEVESTTAASACMVSASASPESSSVLAQETSHSQVGIASLPAEVDTNINGVPQVNKSSSSTFFDISSSFDANGCNHDHTASSGGGSGGGVTSSLAQPAKLLSRFSANSLATLPLTALTRGLSDGLSKGSLVRESFNDLIAMACTGAGGSVDGEFDLQAHTASSSAAAAAAAGSNGTVGSGASGATLGSGASGSPSKWQHDRRARRNRLAQTIGSQRSKPNGFGLGLTPRHSSSSCHAAASSLLLDPPTFTAGSGGGSSSSFGSNLGGGRSGVSNRGASSGRYRKTSDDFEDSNNYNGGSMDGANRKSSSSRGSEELYDDFDDQFDLNANGGYASSEFCVGLGGENQYEEGDDDEADDHFSAHSGSSSGSFDGSGSYEETGGGKQGTRTHRIPPPPPLGVDTSPSAPQQPAPAVPTSTSNSPGGSSSSSSSGGQQQRKGTSGSVECDDLETLGLFGPSYTAMMAQDSPHMPARGRKTVAAVAAGSKTLRGTAIDHGNQGNDWRNSGSGSIGGILKRP